MIKYTNRYNDTFTFTKQENGDILWEGDFKYCRFAWPNVYKDAYQQYRKDGGTMHIDEFKKAVVSEFETGSLSVPQLSRVHSVHFQTIYNWIYKFSTFNEKGYRVVEMKDSTSTKLKEQEQRIKELERAVGQKQLKIDYLEKLIELAGGELGMD